MCAHAQFREKGIFFMGCEEMTKEKRVAKKACFITKYYYFYIGHINIRLS
jgi:hypothetical protein